MEHTDATQKTFDYFQSGFHCAESISKAIVEIYGETPAHDIPKVASGFGGGIGKCKEDTCGAVTGGIIALGYLYGRTEPGTDFRNAWELSAEFRKQFIDKFGTANCGRLLEQFGEQENMIKCKNMTAEAAGILSALIRGAMDSDAGETAEKIAA